MQLYQFKGTVVTTTTTTTTEKYSDGSTGKKVKVETETAKRVTGATTTSSSGGCELNVKCTSTSESYTDSHYYISFQY
jgi:hypothetical protein